MRTAAATGGDGVVGLAAATQHHKHQRQPSLGLLSLLRAALGTRKQEDAAGNLPPTRRLGQRRASLSGQDNKMQMASSPRGCLLAPNHRRRSPADQLVVVVPREGWWREGREGGEGRWRWRWRWRGDRRISLRSAALSFTSVCWLSSGEQIGTNRICCSSPTSLAVMWPRRPARLSLEDYTLRPPLSLPKES